MSIYTHLAASIGEPYGSARIQALLSELPPKKGLRKQGGDRASLTFKDQGIELIFDWHEPEWLSASAILFAPGVDGFGGFVEPIEGRLPIASHRPDVHAALGAPSRTGGGGKSSGVITDYSWDRYDFERYHLRFDYESEAGAIRVVYLMSQACARDLNPDLREGGRESPSSKSSVVGRLLRRLGFSRQRPPTPTPIAQADLGVGRTSAMKTDDVIRALEEFVPGGPDENDARLSEIFDGFRTLPDRDRGVPAIFALLERCVGAELGTPGPIVHELEAIAGYETALRESVARLPTALGVWMVNRILNSRPDSAARASWMQLLELASRHPLADDWVREDAARFLAHQKEREE